MAIASKHSSKPSNNQIGRFIQEHNLRGIVEIGIIILVAVLVAFLVRTFLLQLFYIPSESMDPYLKTNDKVFVNKLSYSFHEVERGDVVVFKAPDSVRKKSEADHAINPNVPIIEDLIKRIIGLPGETVEGKCPDVEATVCDVDVYVNGRKLNEPYIGNDVFYAPFEPITIPQGSYLMMGDNRDNSDDGRKFGTIPKSELVGRAFFRLWPLKDFGFL